MAPVVPFTTLGGAAHPDRQDYFHRWWEICDLGPSTVLQAQVHKTATLPFRLARVLLLPFYDIDRVREDVLRSNGDVLRGNGTVHVEPYRIIVRHGPEYLCRTRTRFQPALAPPRRAPLTRAYVRRFVVRRRPRSSGHGEQRGGPAGRLACTPQPD